MNRNKYIDFLKGILIILVVLGHSFQNSKSYEDLIIRVIYSFHMPAFMLISGYLFHRSYEKNKGIMIKKQIKHIGIPIIIWTALHAIPMTIISGGGYIRNVILWLPNLWYLWAVLLISIGVTIVEKIDRYYLKLIVYFIIYIMTFLIPENLSISLWKFMFPFFLFGFYFSHVTNLNQRWGQSIFLKMIIVLVFIGIFQFFHRDQYIYTTGMYIFGNNKTWTQQIIINVYRMILGFFASGVFFILAGKVYTVFRKRKITALIEYCGENSLVLYILPIYLKTYGVKILSNGIVYELFEAVLLIGITIMLHKIVLNIGIYKKYFLGKM